MGCGLIRYELFITGDCTSSGVGEIYIELTGGTAPYTVTETSSSGLLPTSAATTTYYFSGLTAGTYVLEVTDNCLSPGPTTEYINIPISSGSTINIISVTETTCGENNGSVEFEFDPFYGSGYYELYETILGYVTSGETTQALNNVGPLSAGTYYILGDDGGGCTGTSATFVVLSSNTLDYGFYVVNDASCVVGTGAGKIFVTGTTGTPPYTYLWSNSATTSSITGLTAGSYGVTVTDSDGCSLSKTVDVDYVLPIGVVSINTVPPSCFLSDGQLTLIVTGGTAPFYYSGSNGTVEISFSDTYTFSGLASGYFEYLVTDAGLCTTTDSVLLVTPNSFSFGSVTTTNSTCNGSNGTIEITVNGGSPVGTYTYKLIDSSGNTIQNIVTATNTTFNNVPSGNYTFTIGNGGCEYTGTTSISNTDKFTISSITTTGTTCGFCNGSVQIVATSGGTLPYTYQIDGFPTSPVTTYNNLCAGYYTAIVTDADGCSQSQNFVITQSSKVTFLPYTQEPIIGNDGLIKIFVTNGTPPFTYNWSSNVNGQVGPQVTGLTAGTYVIEVIDSTFCSSKKTIKLTGTKQVASYEIYNVCQGSFQNDGTISVRSFGQMYSEGYFSLTEDDLNCILNNATFIAEVVVDGEVHQQTFYTSTNIGDYPTIETWIETLQDLFGLYPNIGEVTFDIENNTMKVYNFCEETDGCQPKTYNELTNSLVIVNLIINYDISCVECDIPPTPTPTLTPTLTPTPTPTLTPTPSPEYNNAFITVWDTSITYPGSTGSLTVRLPFVSSTGSYSNGLIDWGDGNTSTLSYTNRQHTYGAPGQYTIKIYVYPGGTFSGWQFGGGNSNGVDREKILKVLKWGPIQLMDTDDFYECVNLNMNYVVDTPNISSMAFLDYFFYGCTNITTINNIGNWDVSNIFTMFEFLGGGTTLTTANYNSMLQGWASLGTSLQNGVTLDAQTTTYSAAPSAGETARNYLVSTKGWIINDGGPI
jgi:surface protein